MAKSVIFRNPFFIGLISWLIPGLGFFFLGPQYKKKAILYFVIVHLTFIIGAVLRGGVNPNIVSEQWMLFVANSLTFVVQMGAGWLSIVSLTASHAGCPVVGAIPSAAYFELGSLYCLVAGALNYFIFMQAVDRMHKKPYELLARK